MRRPAPEDLTARARIRDAALVMFAERGTEKATIRDIAGAAGVSAGLVRHHFGSKDELRDVCDAYALDRIMELKDRALTSGFGDLSFLGGQDPEFLGLYRYFARALLDGSTAAAAMFDRMVVLAEQWVLDHRPDVTTDPRGYAAVLVSMQLGMLGMHDHLSRAVGGDMLTVDGYVRTTRALIDMHSTALLTAEQAAQANQAFDRLEKQREGKS
jgi:AcrR family transcriptional regulator